MQRSQRQLIRLAQKGDAQAFSSLFEAHQDRIYHIALQMMRNRDDALDAAQEAMIKMYRRLSSFREEADFATWSYRVVVNTCLDMLRKRRKRPLDSLEQIRELGFDVAAQGGTEEDILRREESNLVHRALDTLSAAERTIIVLRDIQGFSYEQISEILDLPLGTTKSRLFRARASLRGAWLEMMEQSGQGARQTDGKDGVQHV
ncbi:MAG: RNA polymerase sigma factor [Christensenellales bacterium]|jgi:RNA polymerase sigma-70 factor (ECF subfamily)